MKTQSAATGATNVNGSSPSRAAHGSGFGCPKCGSTNICGLVAAFWAGIDAEGNPTTRLMHLVESDTEIGIERMCSDCSHEWSEGDTPNDKLRHGGENL